MIKKTLFFAFVTFILLTGCKRPPVACIDVSEEVATVGTPVTFTTCSKRALSYQWYITGPDGAPENDRAWSEIQFNNTFTIPGSYTVTLTAYRDYSWLGESSTTERIITVNG